jgi:hypothetical protein
VVDQINWLTFRTDENTTECPDCNITCPDCPDCNTTEYIYSDNFNDDTADGWQASTAILTVADGQLTCAHKDSGERLLYLSIQTEVNQWYELYTSVTSAIANNLRLAVSTTPTFANAPFIWGWPDGFNPQDSNITVFKFKATGTTTYIMFGDKSSTQSTYATINYLRIKKSDECPEPEPCVCPGTM